MNIDALLLLTKVIVYMKVHSMLPSSMALDKCIHHLISLEYQIEVLLLPTSNPLYFTFFFPPSLAIIDPFTSPIILSF